MNRDICISLIIGLKSGSYEDFDKLYAIYSDMLYGFVLNLTKSPSEAEDILQETFLRIWKARTKISENKSFKSYLYTIAQNLIIDSFRNQMKSVAFEEYINSEAYQSYAENCVEKEVDFDEFRQVFEKAKRKLTERQRQIFELSREQELSISVIAEKLHLSEKTVKNQLSLAMKMLREELSYYYFFLFLFLKHVL
ncbi:MAG: RNA polymerase sigma-70 factor [Tannerella sp.]|jgi:RNA polymerase sigma-70 factor (ECF subfamily)|nr:RNA polymerase sigma-70 factor [Tannerella sp.]